MQLTDNIQKKFEKIIKIYDEISSDEIYENLELYDEKAKILKLANDISGTKFKIAFIGEFNTGKSTMINSFIQKDILPAKYKPTTNQITVIKDSRDSYVRILNQPETSLELTNVNVSKLNGASRGGIEIGVKLPNLTNYELYDTPGVNDPSMFSDEIVFDLIGQVDVVVFVMHATQVLKQSEIDFLTKLIRIKDISKFFFIINQIDLIGEKKYNVRDDFLEKLSNLINVSQTNLANKVFLYSAKKCLEGIKKSDDALLKEYGYDAVIGGIDSYIKRNKRELFKDIADRELNAIAQDSLLKIETAIDKINDKDKEYAGTLKAIEEEINNFQTEIEDAIYDFRKNFDNQKNIFKRNISSDFDAIATTMIGEIVTIPIEKLTQDRYIEIRTKKLIEDATNEEFEIFAKNLQINFEKLDSSIQPIYRKSNIVINDLVSKNYASTIVNGIALGGATIGAVVYTPTILVLGATAIGVSAITSAAANFMPGIGGAIAGGVGSAINTATNLAMQAGKFAFDLAKWGVNGLGDFANTAEDIVKVKQYQKNVKTSIVEIKETILINIDKEMQADKYIELFIREKFPQKEEMEKKIELSKQEFSYKLQNKTDMTSKLENVYQKLSEV